MNDVQINGDTATIYIKSKKYGTREVLIDTEDVEKIFAFGKSWFLLVTGKSCYAQAKKRGNRFRREYMHKIILNCSDDMEIDHINRNGLDNRKDNLRAVLHRHNMQNQDKHVNNKSGFRNVYWDKRNLKWKAQLRKDGVTIRAGSYASVHDAAMAATRCREQLFPYAMS